MTNLAYLLKHKRINVFICRVIVKYAVINTTKSNAKRFTVYGLNAPQLHKAVLALVDCCK